jgi:hypothetical protein
MTIFYIILAAIWLTLVVGIANDIRKETSKKETLD